MQKNNFDRQIAVIIPVYNVGKLLKKCIKSILKQSFTDFRLVLVDDGSTDESGTICDEYAVKDERVTVIHQKNKGSVEARKTGVFSEEAQQAKYITFSDADDTFQINALQTLYDLAEKYQADLVCGNMKRIWKAFSIPQNYQPPCFKIQTEEIYSHEEVIEKLYVSCFGISNFPVNLVAKLYKTELITKASNESPIVRFMGDDLSVILRVMPEVKKLVVTSDIIYNYRIGGGTSKFMPYMLEDFLALYNYKLELSKIWTMPYDVERLMNIELMNIVDTYLQMCVRNGKYTEEQLHNEVEKILENPLILKAAEKLCEDEACHSTAMALNKKNCSDIENKVYEIVKKTYWKYMLKKIILAI